MKMNICEICNKPTTNKRFCSLSCKNKGHSLELTGREREPWPSEARARYSSRLKASGERAGANNPMYGRHQSLEVKQAISLKNKGRKHTEEWRKLASQRSSGENNARFGAVVLPETRRKISEIKKRRCQDPQEVARLLKQVIKGVKPTKLEQRLMQLIKDYNLPFKYVGDGKVWIAGKCPDFININGKKQFIEVFGIYWHDIFDVARRIEHFRQYGFDTLVIWEDELSNIPKVAKRIKRFTKTASKIEVGA